MSMAKSDQFLSVVVPCRNLEHTILPALEKVIDIVEKHFHFFEIVIVDDFSQDSTVQKVSLLLGKQEGLRLVLLERSFGVDVAISAGLDGVIGDYVVILDILTDPPHLIPEMVKRCELNGGGYYGVPKRTKSFRPVYSVFSLVFEWYCRKFLEIDIQRKSGIFRIFNRASINNLLSSSDRVRALRIMTANLGTKLHSFEYTPLQNQMTIQNDSFLTN